MKFLKVLVAIIAILVAVGVILALTTDGKYEVERSTEIDGCYGDVYEQISNFERWTEWGPWDEKADDIVYTFDGEMGTVGSSYAWESASDQVGAGSMTCTAITEDRMDYHLHFTRPYEAESDGYIKMEAVGEGKYKVAWGFYGELGFPVSLFMDMDKAVGPDFEKGLANIKAAVDAIEKSDFAPNTVTREDTHYIGKVAHVRVDEITSDMYAQNYGAIMGYMMENELEMNMSTMPFTIFHTFDEATMEADMEFGIAVLSAHEAGDGFSSGTIPAGEYLSASHYGNYDSTGDTWMAMDAYIACNGIELGGSPFEVYVTDPTTEPDTAKWETQIIYPLAAAAE